ncbi:fungal-specific transcription factor domain-containing protein [Annulohypoxylon moriforme]|nr:fungal-specific transcription factor domain-containing protein [Annulohypoxylon moriforme]
MSAPLPLSQKRIPVMKRKYATTACEPCRKRHAKCDGVTPVCSRCSKRTLTCTYPKVEDGRRPAPKSYVHMLRERINILERTLEAHSLNVETAVARTLKATAGVDDQQSSNQQGASGPVCVGTLSKDALLNFDSDGEARYFGIASGRLEFGNDICDNPQNQPATGGDSQAEITRLRINQFCQDTIHEQPISPELEEELIQIYFKWEQPWVQVVDEKLFRDHRATKGKYFSPLLLNCILAVASRLGHHEGTRSVPDDPKTAGVYFLEKAEILLHYELRWPSITTIQSLSILGIVYVAIGSDAAGWLHAGMAARLALDMGLNLDPANVISTGWLKPELRRRIYWTLYCLDKLSSTYLGRVCTMLESQANVRLPAPRSPATSSKDRLDQEASGSILDRILRSLVTVCRIVEQILLALYYPKSRMPRQERDLFISKTTLELKNWYYDLPKELGVEYNGILQDQPAIYILHMVYHTSIILLVKPSLLRSQDESARRMSYQAAIDICSVATKYRRRFTSFRQSPITATHCTLSAVLILISAGTHEWQGVSAASNSKNIELGLTVLDELSASWHPAKRIRQGLERLYKSSRESTVRTQSSSVAGSGSVEQFHSVDSEGLADSSTSDFSNVLDKTGPALPSINLTPETFETGLFHGSSPGNEHMVAGFDITEALDNFSYMESNPMFLSDALPNDYSGFDILTRIHVQRS